MHNECRILNRQNVITVYISYTVLSSHQSFAVQHKLITKSRRRLRSTSFQIVLISFWFLPSFTWSLWPFFGRGKDELLPLPKYSHISLTTSSFERYFTETKIKMVLLQRARVAKYALFPCVPPKRWYHLQIHTALQPIDKRKTVILIDNLCKIKAWTL
jgi:hypothetical protein